MSNETWRPFTIEDALRIRVFAERAPIRLSADGRFLAYSVEDRSADAVREQVWITDVDTGESRHVLPEALIAWGASWSPTEPVLAFVGDTGEGPRLWVCGAKTGETRQVSLAALAYDEYLRFYLPQWLPDGSALICTLASRIGRPGYDHLGQRVSRKAVPVPELAANAPSVRLWESLPRDYRPGHGEAPDPEVDGRWSTLARVNLHDGAITPLVNDIQCGAWEVSPDGRHVAFLRVVSQAQPGAEGDIYELCVIEAHGGPVRVLDGHVEEWYAVSLSWSPDSATLAYCPNHNVAVVGMQDGEPRLLARCGGVMDEFYESPLWSPDGSFLLATRHDSVWRIPVAEGEPADLLPNRGPLLVRGIAAPGGGPTLSDRHLQGAQGEAAVQRGLHRPAHDPPRVQIHRGRQVLAPVMQQLQRVLHLAP